MLFGIYLTTVLLLKIKVSLTQQCTISCTQTAVLRNMPYEDIFETIENREWENEDDFGEDFLDLIQRHKRVKRQAVLPNDTGSEMTEMVCLVPIDYYGQIHLPP